MSNETKETENNVKEENENKYELNKLSNIFIENGKVNSLFIL
jgi:hypothetical protein